MIEKVIGCAFEGIEAQKVEFEVNVSRGAKFLLVGLPDNAVKESHYRISAALKNIGFKIPVKLMESSTMIPKMSRSGIFGLRAKDK